MKSKWLLIAIIVIVGLIAAKNYAGKDTPISKLENEAVDTAGSATAVSPQDFAKLAENPNAFILDVHTPEQTHIPGTDALISYNEVKDRASELPEDKNTPILVYCRSGSMSEAASKDLVELGYSNVYDLQGGSDAYREQQVSVSMWPETKDLGTVIYGDVATTEFTLTNFTPLPTKITRLSTSCGCTSAEAEKEVLAPYESTTIKVSFDPAVHKDDTDVGDITRTIYLETDNPNFPQFETTITGTVVKQ